MSSVADEAELYLLGVTIVEGAERAIERVGLDLRVRVVELIRSIDA